MRGSRNFRRGGGGGGGGRGGVHVNLTNKSSDSVVCLFFAFFLVLGLVYRSQMVNFKEKYHFSRFRRGSEFSRGVQLFPGGGVQLLIPYFSRGGGGSGPFPPPLSGSALGCDLFSFPVRKMM